MENTTLILAKLDRNKRNRTTKHKRAYFRLEYKNKYPDPEKYF